jgi:hypothetical protein
MPDGKGGAYLSLMGRHRWPSARQRWRLHRLLPPSTPKCWTKCRSSTTKSDSFSSEEHSRRPRGSLHLGSSPLTCSPMHRVCRRRDIHQGTQYQEREVIRGNSMDTKRPGTTSWPMLLNSNLRCMPRKWARLRRALCRCRKCLQASRQQSFCPSMHSTAHRRWDQVHPTCSSSRGSRCQLAHRRGMHRCQQVSQVRHSICMTERLYRRPNSMAISVRPGATR